MKKISVLFVTFVLLFSMMPVNAASNTKYKSTRRPVAVTQLVKVKQPVAEAVKTVQPTTETVTTVQPTTEPVSTVQPIEQPVAQPTNSVNVLDFGAKGDGTTDDTAAIQKAIDSASASNVTVVFPATANFYRINNTLILKSNTSISGYGATLYMPSQDSPKIMLRSSGVNYIKNVKIAGLALKSTNDKNGTNYEENSLTSNVQAIYIQGIDTLTIKDVRMDNMYNGLKLNASDNGTVNVNVKMDNMQIYNSRTPVYADGTNGFYMTNSVLDAGGGATHWLHCVYISADTNDFVFDNVQFKNSPGGGMTIGSSYPDRADPVNITIKNSSIENCNRGFNIYGASNVTATNVDVTKCNLGLAIHGGTNINLNDLRITNATQTKSLSGSDNKGAFEISDTYQSKFSDITIDAAGMAGSLFNLEDKIQNLTLSEFTVTNMEDIRFIEPTSNSINNLTVENSKFEWSSITTRRINFRAAGSSAVFRNNVFTNKGNAFDSLVYNESGTDILLENNSYSGFKTLEYIDEYSKTNNNLNLDTNVAS